MTRIILILIVLLNLVSLQSKSQQFDSLLTEVQSLPDDSSKVNMMLDFSRQLFGSDPERAIEIGQEAHRISTELFYPSGIALANKNIGIGHYVLSEYSVALQYWDEAKRVYSEIGDQVGVSNMLSNMGAVYFNEGEHTKAIDHYLQSLTIAEQVKDTVRIATALQNIGAVHDENKEFEQSLQAYLRALPLFIALNDADGTGLTSLNIGTIYLKQEDYELALDYHKKVLDHSQSTSYHSAGLSGMGTVLLALNDDELGMSYLDSACVVSKELGDDLEIARALNSLAKAHESKENWGQAMEIYKDAESHALKVNQSNLMLRDSYEGLVRLYSKRGDYPKAFEYKTLLENVNDSIYNIESDKKLNRMLFTFEIEKKEGEIALLTKDKELQEFEVRRQKAIRNGFVFGFAVVLLFAGIFFGQRNKIKKGKKLSDELLLNILPEEVAEELKNHGSAAAKQFDQVSVLFTDFKEFTKVSEILSATELVAEINIYFQAFDHIMTKYDIEKIKTIGDAYMAVAGLPVPIENAEKKVVLAAIEMLDFINDRKRDKALDGKPAFDMRVGIHTGAVVAGIVGIKKFQYDIWGDTVNTASRMESSGSVGQVNISEFTYEILKNDPDFSFEPRGLIKAKGKGEMAMYFVKLAEVLSTSS